MQTMSAGAALQRGLRLFAGMLAGPRKVRSTTSEATARSELVSWCSEARTRRGDEMARSRCSQSVPEGEFTTDVDRAVRVAGRAMT